MHRKPPAFIQVDLDGLWAVRRCYGCPGQPEEDDPVYSQALPALLALFDHLGIRATFFVVGSDIRVTWKLKHLTAVLDGGHEIANHSMTHDLGFARLDENSVRREIADCGQLLRETLDVEARGFRAPGYAFRDDLAGVLSELGFWYDASLLPSPWSGLMRGISRWISKGPSNGPRYGAAGGGRRSTAPYPADGAGGAEALWEIPVSVSRRMRMPIHGGVGYLLGRRWVERAVEGLHRRESALNYLIHGMDLVDGNTWQVTPTRRGRRFFAGDTSKRLDFFERVCGRIAEMFEIRRTDQWVRQKRKAKEND